MEYSATGILDRLGMDYDDCSDYDDDDEVEYDEDVKLKIKEW